MRVIIIQLCDLIGRIWVISSPSGLVQWNEDIVLALRSHFILSYSNIIYINVHITFLLQVAFVNS